MTPPPRYAALRDHDLNQLGALHALLSSRSVTQAAALLGLSQPALSKQLERLRAAFDDPLLVREGNRMRLTPRAQTLLPLVEAALAALSGVFTAQGPFDPALVRGRLRVGANDYVQAVLGAPLLRRLRERAPGLVPEFRPVGMLHPEQLLADGVVDLVIGPQWPNLALRDRRLYSDPFVCVLGADARVPARALDAAAFAALPMVDVSPSGTGMLRTLIERGIAGVQRRVVATASSFLALPQLLRGTGLAALVPQRLLDLYPPGVLQPAAVAFELPAYEVSLWWHNATHADPLQRWVRAQLVELAAEPR
jgi:DNA-binding transcriptional LysR family regulator